MIHTYNSIAVLYYNANNVGARELFIHANNTVPRHISEEHSFLLLLLLCMMNIWGTHRVLDVCLRVHFVLVRNYLLMLSTNRETCTRDGAGGRRTCKHVARGETFNNIQ